MPGTIESDQVVINACESTTNFASLGTWGANPAVSNDVYLQGANAINARASTTVPLTVQMAWSHSTTAAALNLTTGRHVFMWVKCFSLPSMEKRVRGGIGVSISSDTTPTLSGSATTPWSGATNSKQWFVTGADYEPLSGWSCYVVDPNGVPDLTLGTCDVTSIDRVGVRAGALQTVGGGSVKPNPVIWDRIAYGTGLTIVSGTSGAPVTLEDVYVEDSKTANQFGVVSKVAGLYLGSGKLTVGKPDQVAVTTFADMNKVLVFNDMPVSSTFYEIRLRGAASFATTVTLGTYTGSLASQGCNVRGSGLNTRRLIAPVIVNRGTGYVLNDILTASVGTYSSVGTFRVTNVVGGLVGEIRPEIAGSYSQPPTGTIALAGGTGTGCTINVTPVGGSIWTLNANEANQYLNLYACTLSEMYRGNLSNTSTCRATSFQNFGTIDASGAFFDDCTFQDLFTRAPISASYAVVVSGSSATTLTNCKFVNCATAVLWNFNTDTGTKLDGSNFTSGGTGHAIELRTNTPVTCSFASVTFAGYGGTPGTNLTPNAGSTDAAVYNNSGKQISINVTNGTVPSVRNGAGASTYVNSSIPLEVNGITEGSRVIVVGSGGAEDGVILMQDYADSTGKVVGTYTGAAPQGVLVKVRNSGIVAAALQDDGGSFTNYTNDARDKTGTNDVVILPAVPAVDDAFYVGGLTKFGQILINVTVAGTTYVIAWEYWNGSTWSALGVTDSSSSFHLSGWQKITFVVPSNWSASTVFALGPYYYVRARVTIGGGTGPLAEEVTLNRTVKYLPFQLSTTIVAGTGLLTTAVWLVDLNAE